MCKEQGRFSASVTYMNGFLNDINFLCRCKHNFSLMNFPDFDINAVLIRNLITNGISKQQFQRVLQVGNFGANVEGVDRSVNLSTKSMMTVYKEQNDEIIQGAHRIQKAAMEDLHRANKAITIRYTANINPNRYIRKFEKYLRHIKPHFSPISLIHFYTTHCL